MGIFDELGAVVNQLTEQDTFPQKYLSVITLKSCLNWVKEMRTKFPQSMGFLISIKDNPSPRNENDVLILTLAMVDGQNQPVHYDASNGVSTLVHGKTVDADMLNLLDGNDSMICKF